MEREYCTDICGADMRLLVGSVTSVRINRVSACLVCRGMERSFCYLQEFLWALTQTEPVKYKTGKVQSVPKFLHLGILTAPSTSIYNLMKLQATSVASNFMKTEITLTFCKDI
jgi:hypothetical protein